MNVSRFSCVPRIFSSSFLGSFVIVLLLVARLLLFFSDMFWSSHWVTLAFLPLSLFFLVLILLHLVFVIINNILTLILIVFNLLLLNFFIFQPFCESALCQCRITDKLSSWKKKCNKRIAHRLLKPFWNTSDLNRRCFSVNFLSQKAKKMNRTV